MGNAYTAPNNIGSYVSHSCAVIFCMYSLNGACVTETRSACIKMKIIGDNVEE